MDDDIPTAPMFRVSKRRKFVRKRTDSTEALPDSPAPEETQIEGKAPTTDGEDTGANRVQRRGHAKKHGIAFTSSASPRIEGEPVNEEMALVVSRPEEALEMAGGDRFVKPTGRVAVAEDKHMMAYIDSKLAEVRSKTVHAETNVQSVTAEHEVEESDTSAPSQPSNPQRSTDRVHNTADARSPRSYQRPTKRRAKPSRDEADLARDSMIDQIMQEAQVPLYDRTEATKTYGDGSDNDAATAEAFRADLIAEMELRNRRRLAPKPAAKDAQAVSGPKLGGSRAQRERMKAAMEGKGGTATK